MQILKILSIYESPKLCQLVKGIPQALQDKTYHNVVNCGMSQQNLPVGLTVGSNLGLSSKAFFLIHLVCLLLR